jgi:hypothetical protein
MASRLMAHCRWAIVQVAMPEQVDQRRRRDEPGDWGGRKLMPVLTGRWIGHAHRNQMNHRPGTGLQHHGEDYNA